MSEVIILQEESFETPDDRYLCIRMLWFRAIILAIKEHHQFRRSSKLEEKRWARDAEIWLFQKSHLFNGFENICHHLNIDPDRLRNRIKTMSRDDIEILMSKIEFLDRRPGAVPLRELEG
jgi:hypothetical protein